MSIWWNRPRENTKMAAPELHGLVAPYKKPFLSASHRMQCWKSELSGSYTPPDISVKNQKYIHRKASDNHTEMCWWNVLYWISRNQPKTWLALLNGWYLANNEHFINRYGCKNTWSLAKAIPVSRFEPSWRGRSIGAKPRTWKCCALSSSWRSMNKCFPTYLNVTQ